VVPVSWPLRRVCRIWFTQLPMEQQKTPLGPPSCRARYSPSPFAQIDGVDLERPSRVAEEALGEGLGRIGQSLDDAHAAAQREATSAVATRHSAHSAEAK
jgi:hypothetical protein